MLTFSYTISPSVKNDIERIIKLRDNILTEPLSRSQELQLRWETSIERTKSNTLLAGEKLDKQGVIRRITLQKNKPEYDIDSYVNAYEWLNQHWFLNKGKVDIKTVKKVCSFLSESRLDEKQLQDALDFIQVKPEHPIIQTGLAFFLFTQSLNHNNNNIKLSIILSNIFLYKNFLDFRGMLNIEEFIGRDLQHLEELLKDAQSKKNLSSFLEYYASAVAISAEEAVRRVKTLDLKHNIPSSFFEITERQKDILSLFLKPGTKVTNKTVQKEFKVSQITASRDLAKLNTLGLIFSAGKGRSIYYTRS